MTSTVEGLLSWCLTARHHLACWIPFWCYFKQIFHPVEWPACRRISLFCNRIANGYSIHLGWKVLAIWRKMMVFPCFKGAVLNLFVVHFTHLSYSCSIKTFLNNAEVRRVLKPGGLYLFIEHVAARGTSFSLFCSELHMHFIARKPC